MPEPASPMVWVGCAAGARDRNVTPCQHPRTSASGWRIQGCLPSATAVSEGGKESPSTAAQGTGSGQGGKLAVAPSPKEKPTGCLEQLQQLWL